MAKLSSHFVGEDRSSISYEEFFDVAVFPLGRDEEENWVELDLYRGSHVAVQGMTRSGKSVLLMGILADFSGHLPGSVEVCGVDPTGVLLRPWLFQSDRISTSGDSRDALRVVNGLVDEMDRRISTLETLRTDKLSGHAAKPYLIVVLDEYPGTLARADLEERSIGKALRLGVQRLVLEGAKVGVRVIIAAQKALSDTLGSEVRANLDTRISFRVDSPESVKLLHPSLPNPAAMVEEMRKWPPGVALFDAPGEPMRVFRAENVSYDHYLRTVEEMERA